MRKLIQGSVDFRERVLPKHSGRFRTLSQGQSPEALFITCCDSRVVPDFVVSTGPGDVFVLRNIGNLIPPSAADGAANGDVSAATAIEYALAALKIEHIVICGHSECGAMAAAAAEHGTPPEMVNLPKWLQYATPSVDRLRREGPLDGTLTPNNQLSQWNVLVQLEHLATYPIVHERMAAGVLQLHAWWFEIAGGQMFAFDSEKRSFKPIDRYFAAQLMERLDQKPGMSGGGHVRGHGDSDHAGGSRIL